MPGNPSRAARAARASDGASTPRIRVREEIPAMVAVAVAALLSLAVPLTGGAWRDDRLGALALAFAALLLPLLAAGPAAARRLEVFGRDVRLSALLAGAALLLADTALSALSAPYRDAALQRLVTEAAIGGAFLAAAALAAAEARAARLFLDACVAGLAILAGLAFARGGTGGALAWPFVNHGQLGGVLAAGAILALPRPGSRRGTLDAWLRAPVLLRAGITALLTASVAATRARSAYLALAAALFAFQWLSQPSRGGAREGAGRSSRLPSRLPGIVGAALGLGAALVLAVLWVDPSSLRWSPDQVARSGSLQERIAVWRSTLALAATHPLAGAGLGAYGSAIWKFTPPEVGGTIEHAHSQPLEVLAERGLPGVAAFALVGTLLLGALRAPGPGARGRDDDRDADLQLRAALGAAALLAQGCVDVALVTPGIATLAAALLGASVGTAARRRDSGAAPRFDDEPAAERASRAPRATRAILAGGALLAFLSGVAWLHFSGARGAAQAAFERGDVESGLAFARRAADQNPDDRWSRERLANGGDLARYSELARLDPADPWAAIGAALVLESEDHDTEADVELGRAIRNFPRGYEPRRARLEFLARRGRIADALDEARALATARPEHAIDATLWLAEFLDDPLLAETLAPADPTGRRVIAEWVLEKGRPDAALRLLEDLSIGTAARSATHPLATVAAPGAGPSAALAHLVAPVPAAPAISSADAAHHLLLARARAAAGRTAEARATLRELLGDRATASGAAAALAELAQTPAEIAEAEGALRAALAASFDASAAIRLVALVDRSGRKAEADHLLDTLLASRPDASALVALRLARRASTGDLAGAMSDARRLIDLQPHDPAGRLALARLYERRGMAAGARQLYQEALDLAPGNVEAVAALERLSRPSGS